MICLLDILQTWANLIDWQWQIECRQWRKTWTRNAALGLAHYWQRLLDEGE
jgi:hypothetical protein